MPKEKSPDNEDLDRISPFILDGNVGGKLDIGASYTQNCAQKNSPGIFPNPHAFHKPRTISYL